MPFADPLTWPSATLSPGRGQKLGVEHSLLLGERVARLVGTGEGSFDVVLLSSLSRRLCGGNTFPQFRPLSRQNCQLPFSLLVSGADERLKERMRLKRSRLKFGVKLTP